MGGLPAVRINMSPGVIRPALSLVMPGRVMHSPGVRSGRAVSYTLIDLDPPDLELEIEAFLSTTVVWPSILERYSAVSARFGA